MPRTCLRNSCTRLDLRHKVFSMRLSALNPTKPSRHKPFGMRLSARKESEPFALKLDLDLSSPASIRCLQFLHRLVECARPLCVFRGCPLLLRLFCIAEQSLSCKGSTAYSTRTVVTASSNILKSRRVLQASSAIHTVHISTIVYYIPSLVIGPPTGRSSKE